MVGGEEIWNKNYGVRRSSAEIIGLAKGAQPEAI